MSQRKISGPCCFIAGYRARSCLGPEQRFARYALLPAVGRRSGGRRGQPVRSSQLRLEIIADFGDERLAFAEPGTEAT